MTPARELHALVVSELQQLLGACLWCGGLFVAGCAVALGVAW